MLLFLKSNGGTLFIGAILLIGIAWIIIKILKEKREGRSPCGCKDCGMCMKCYFADQDREK